MALQAFAGERGALFKVTRGDHVLYLYGTIHAGKPEYYPLEPRMRTAVEQAPVLALEIDAMRDPAAAAAAFQQHGLFPADSPGYAGLAPERRQRIDTALKRQGVDPAAVAHVKPWMLTTMLAMMDMAKLGYDPALGVDQHLAQLVRGKRPIVELETVGYQASLLDRLPLEMQWRLLEETLEHMASGRQLREAREMFAAYEQADQGAQDALLNRIETDDSLEAKLMRELLLGERNGPMADKLAALLARENNVVAAVGLLHLLGKGGVPELLRRRGMRVERVY
ncbi:TraB/GumN family protein [Massilia sp. Dwa41.01b]|nr:TraB/GumN family protein [Massilia sp. Dwa41.01b]QNA98125.1 TraB/GumN family protein [Massilia sp. Se16.2.3]